MSKKTRQRRSYGDRNFQFMSDLRLEVGSQYSTFQPPVRAQFLILAGDIDSLSNYQSYLSFLEAQCKRFVRVFLVLGNHEFYGESRQNGLQAAAKLEQEPSLLGRLTILDHKKVDVSERITILGCTLHSHISPKNRAAIEASVKDFIRIKVWDVPKHNAEHEADLLWLQGQIQNIRSFEEQEDAKPRKIIVVTHHAPPKAGTSEPKNENNIRSDAFATDVIGSFAVDARTTIDYWIFGHTHCTATVFHNGVTLLSKQRGYFNAQRVPGPRPKGLLHWFFGLSGNSGDCSKHQFNVERTLKA